MARGCEKKGAAIWCASVELVIVMCWVFMFSWYEHPGVSRHPYSVGLQVPLNAD